MNAFTVVALLSSVLHGQHEASQTTSTAVQANELTFEKVAHLAKLPELSMLQLNGRMSEQQARSLREVKQLQQLALYNSDVYAATLESLQVMPKFQLLYLEGCSIREGAFRQLLSTSITRIHISSSDLTDTDLGFLKKVRLTQLSLNSTKVSREGFRLVGEMQDLEVLNATNSEVDDVCLASIRGLSKLRHLNIRGSKISGKGMANLESLTAIERLFLDSTGINDASLSVLKSLPRLKTLGLGGASITKRSLSLLGELKGLTYLDLSGLEIEDGDVGAFANLTSLERITLLGTGITSNGVTTLRKSLPKCRIEY